jgi:hypothetical protein
MWQAGKGRAPQPGRVDRQASRWGDVPVQFSAGSTVMLDARPVLVGGS